MSKLDNLIKELCPKGVEYKTIDSFTSILRGKRLTKKELTVDGKYNVFHGGLDPLGRYNECNREADTVMVINVGASAGTVGYCDEDFWSSDGCFCLAHTEHALNKYLYYALLCKERDLQSKVRKAGIPTLDNKEVEKTVIPLPPMEIQREIVRILDNFTELTAELTAELSLRKKQYEYYSTSLFESGDNLKWVKLSEIAEIGTGSSNTNEGLSEGKYPFYVRSQEPLRKNDFEFDEIAILTAGDGVGVGKVFHFVEGKYALHQRAYRIHIVSQQILPKYYFYYMKNTFLQYIEKNMFHGSVSSIRRPMLNNYPVPIPTLDEQRRIINILDRFETLCNDISEGLPAEIEARQKQYEYYRDKLLTFKEISA